MLDTETQRSRGMRDLLPGEMDRVRAVEHAFAVACRAWGYREVRTPVIEPLHLFTSAGTLSPQTLDRVYSFLDWDGWSGERVVLRPDSTIPAARLYSGRLDGGRIAKLFYRQNVFRFGEDGSSREEWQCGAELIGDTGGTGDVDLIALALAALEGMKLEPAVRLSHAGIVRAVLGAAGMTPDEQARAYDRLLDGDEGVIDDVESRLPQLNAPLRLLFEVDGEGAAYIENVRSGLAGSVPALVPALDELALVVKTLEAMGARPSIHAALARSFEYYSGIVMEFDAAGRRVGAGGRYDGLVELVGGKRVPASGFALYVDPLVELMPEPDWPPRAEVRLAVVAASEAPEALAAAQAAAVQLRSARIHAEAVEGADTAPTHRLTCAADSPRYRLDGPNGEQTFDRIDDVARALEAS
jgi:histidyl-tRNA synthetase